MNKKAANIATNKELVSKRIVSQKAKKGDPKISVELTLGSTCDRQLETKDFNLSTNDNFATSDETTNNQSGCQKTSKGNKSPPFPNPYL